MKRMLFVLACSVFLLCSIIGVSAEESLVAYYSLEGDAEDLSGNENHGELVGGTKWDKGEFGDAIHLEVGAHIKMTVSDTLHGDLFKSEPFTISVWINPTFEGGEWQQIWRSLPGAPAGHNTLFVNAVQGLLSWRGVVGGWTILCQTDGGDIKKDEWSHAVVQSDGKKFRIYVNGKLAKETDFQETGGANETYLLGGAGGEGYGGAIDDAAIFSRDLSEAEISALADGLDAFLSVEDQGKLTTRWGQIKGSLSLR